jgi:hypothetical protein
MSGNFSYSPSYGLTLHLDWTATNDVASNSSTVTAKLYLVTTGALYISGVSKAWNIRINGVQQNGSTAIGNYNGTATIQLGTRSVKVTHDANGSKQVNIAATLGINIYYNNTSLKDLTTGGNVALDNIPRANTLNTNKVSYNFDEQITAIINPNGTNYNHKVTFTFGSKTLDVATNPEVGKNFLFSVPSSYASEIPNASSGWGTLNVQTLNGSTVIGTNSIRLTLNIVTANGASSPTINSVTDAEGVAAYKGLINGNVAYIQGRSIIKFVVNATPKNNATITSYQYSIADGAPFYTTSSPTYDCNLANTNALSIGYPKLYVKVIDSRGQVATQQIFIEVLPYDAPKVTNFVATRVKDANGADTDSVKFSLTGTYSELEVDNVSYNKLGFTISSNDGTEVKQISSIPDTPKLTDVTVNSLDKTKAYTFTLSVHDVVATTTTSTTLGTAAVLLSFVKDKTVGIGKIGTRGVLDVEGDAYFKGTLNVEGAVAQVPGLLKDGTDMNTLLNTGKYYIVNDDSGKTMKNLVDPSHGIFEVIKNPSGQYLQRWTPTGGYARARMFIRFSQDIATNVWTPWSWIGGGVQQVKVKGAYNTYFNIARSGNLVECRYGPVALNPATADQQLPVVDGAKIDETIPLGYRPVDQANLIIFRNISKDFDKPPFRIRFDHGGGIYYYNGLNNDMTSYAGSTSWVTVDNYPGTTV